MCIVFNTTTIILLFIESIVCSEVPFSNILTQIFTINIFIQEDRSILDFAMQIYRLKASKKNIMYWYSLLCQIAAIYNTVQERCFCLMLDDNINNNYRVLFRCHLWSISRNVSRSYSTKLLINQIYFFSIISFENQDGKQEKEMYI